MKQSIIFTKNISVGQKVSGRGGAFGEGFNYRVEAGFDLAVFERDVSARELALKALNATLAKIDHKALGVDVNLGFEPTTEALCAFLSEEITRVYPAGVTSLRMLRGDGLSASVGDSV